MFDIISALDVLTNWHSFGLIFLLRGLWLGSRYVVKLFDDFNDLALIEFEFTVDPALVGLDLVSRDSARFVYQLFNIALGGRLKILVVLL